MKKTLPILSAVIAVLFVIISYFAYKTYVGPMYRNNVSQELSVQLVSANQFALVKKPEQKGVFGIELEITGTTKANLGMTFNNGEQNIHSVKIKGGDIDFVYKNDWYTDTLFITFEKDDSEDGKLLINYRFLAL